MSGKRPLFRSPKFGDGMTSEAIEESDVKVCMFAIGRKSGVARRFESASGEANEPSDIRGLKPGRRTATFRSTILRIWLARNRMSGVARAFWPGVCGKHHPMVARRLPLVKKAAALLLFQAVSRFACCQRFLNAE